jgi:hypothetical protein
MLIHIHIHIQLLSSGKQVVAGNVVRRLGRATYDLNTFQNTNYTNEMLKTLEKDYLLLEGYTHSGGIKTGRKVCTLTYVYTLSHEHTHHTHIHMYTHKHTYRTHTYIYIYTLLHEHTHHTHTYHTHTRIHIHTHPPIHTCT